MIRRATRLRDAGVAKYHAAGMLGYSTHGFSRFLRRHGVTYPTWLDRRPSAALTREQLERAVADGLSLKRTAERYGKSLSQVEWARRVHGVRFGPNPIPVADTIELGGQRVTLPEAARITGIGKGTLYWRRRNGWSDADLLRPVRHHRRPKVYDVGGRSVADLEEIAAYAAREAERIGRVNAIKKASALFGLEYGAISAVMRGKWERIG